MRRHLYFDIILFHLLDFEQDFIEFAHFDVAGEDGENIAVAVAASQCAGDYLADLLHFLAFQFYMDVAGVGIDFCLREAVLQLRTHLIF